MITKLWGLIPSQYRIMAVAIILAVATLSIWGYGFARYSAGKSTCEAKYSTARAESAEKAQKKITEVKNGYEKISSKMPVGIDYPAPAVDYVIDRLHDRRGGQ